MKLDLIIDNLSSLYQNSQEEYIKIYILQRIQLIKNKIKGLFPLEKLKHQKITEKRFIDCDIEDAATPIRMY